MTPRLTYWASGGEILASRRGAISTEEARRLSARLLVSAQTGAGEVSANQTALALELTRAIDACAGWRRAAVAHYRPQSVPRLDA